MRYLALFLLVPSIFAQGRFVATTGDVSLSSAGTTLTVQQPATNARKVTLESAIIYCSVACNITQSQNGTAATSTAGLFSPVMPTPGGTVASLKVWTASNVGLGTSVGGILHLSAGQTAVLDLSKIQMATADTGVNYSVTVSSITGVANITIYEVEQ